MKPHARILSVKWEKMGETTPQECLQYPVEWVHWKKMPELFSQVKKKE